jgi:hypothetical protein
MKPIPLMINSDAPTAGSGLGRICGDLARRIAENMPDIFRVCTFGYGGISSIHLPYHQYHIEGMGSDWVMPNLPDVWRDWAGDEKGVYLTINDLSRLGWLLRPKKQCENPILREFLLKKPFQIWTYLPTDAEGPNKKLTFPLQQILQGSDRILAYGKWGADVVDRTMGVVHDYNCSMVVRFATNMVLPDICTCGKGTQYLPHGIDTSVFRERDRTQDRKTFVSYTKSCTLMGNLADRVKSEEVLISIVATNQSRKDWALGIATVAKLSLTHNVRLWIKTDVAERHWSIPALLPARLWSCG